jgi:4'-phosphopantetheinyl transferase
MSLTGRPRGFLQKVYLGFCHGNRPDRTLTSVGGERTVQEATIGKNEDPVERERAGGSHEGQVTEHERCRERLKRDEVHVWTASPEEITDPALLDAYEALESEDERERRLRLRFDRDRHERLVSVALVRTTLARYTDVAPRAWVFERNEHGRPEPVPGHGGPPLRINLSHTRGLVACAVTVDRDIGVDVECVVRRGDPVAIADRYFAPAEVRALHACPAVHRRDRFFQYWTLKESYIKARGMGLRIPLRRFSFHLDAGQEIRVTFDAELEDDARDWQFALFRPTTTHVVAVGVRRGSGPDLSMRIRRTIPLRD